MCVCVCVCVYVRVCVCVCVCVRVRVRVRGVAPRQPQPWRVMFLRRRRAQRRGPRGDRAAWAGAVPGALCARAGGCGSGAVRLTLGGGGGGGGGGRQPHAAARHRNAVALESSIIAMKQLRAEIARKVRVPSALSAPARPLSRGCGFISACVCVCVGGGGRRRSRC